MNAESAFNNGCRAFSERRAEAAIEAFYCAEYLGCEAGKCAAYRWQCWMLLGNFEEAWRESDAISALANGGTHELWDGEPFEGKKVVIRCLHGYGDTIQFLRYAKLVRQTAARVVVETHPEMMSLAQRVSGVDEVITWDSRFDRKLWDQQIEVMELPRAFRTSLCSIPSAVPYIHLCDRAVARSREHLNESGRRKVGLLWASSAWNPARCTRLRDLQPVTENTDCDFYSFQRGPERAELCGVSTERGIRDTAMHSPAIIDTAADLANMDLLITVDTMAAHLAGALGTPVWLLIPFAADWRWMLDRADTPWYPATRLFRQPSGGDWKAVIAQVAHELEHAQHTQTRYAEPS